MGYIIYIFVGTKTIRAEESQRKKGEKKNESTLLELISRFRENF